MIISSLFRSSMILAAASMWSFDSVQSFSLRPTPSFSVHSFCRQHRALLFASSQGKDDVERNAQKIREEAERIRREIAGFEQEKEQARINLQMEKDKIAKEKQDLRDRYAVEIPILKGDGNTVMEKVDFPPRIPGGKLDGDKMNNLPEAMVLIL